MTSPVLLFVACSDYGLQDNPGDPAAAWPPAPWDLRVPPPRPSPRIAVTPAFHDFGVQDPWSTGTQAITVENLGKAPLTVTDLRYSASSTDLAFATDEAANGPLPWTLGPGEAREVEVRYTPMAEGDDEGHLVVASDDPAQPQAMARQVGAAAFDGFTTGWYIVNDDTPYDLTSDPVHRVDYDGDPDAYWYEPSGVHGLTGSADPAADFAVLHDYVVARAGGPTVVTGPLSFYAPSALPDMEQGSFSYLLCDFWMDPTDDPARYAISTGRVDDGVRVIVNGTILGELTYGQSGSWPLTGAVPGTVNSLVVILMDNAMWEKYIYDLAFYRDGIMVGG